MSESHEPQHLAAVPQPDGPSAKNARRAGSPNHQRNTSEENPMVKPTLAAEPVSGPSPVWGWRR
jgi:hypothetical protein